MRKPVILCIMDGYGIRNSSHGNAISEANKPNLDAFFKNYSYTEISASGLDVGLPVGQMGNSEVGHLNIGAGRIVYQSLTLINKAIQDGNFYKNKVYIDAIKEAKKRNSKIHIMGLVSDGGVHSHYEHFIAILDLCKSQNAENVFLHAFMDGRDVDPQNGPSYIKILEDHMNKIKLGKLATISGRYWAMDRDKNLNRFDKAYQILVNHNGPSFTNYKNYFKQQYEVDLPAANMESSDEFVIPQFNSKVPNSKVEDNDIIIFMNFRPDRAIEISNVFTNPMFYSNPPIKEGKSAWEAYVPNPVLKNIYHVSTMKYSDSVKSHIAFSLPSLDNLLGPYVAKLGLKQLRIAETEKYAHVTFFFDGTVNYDGLEKPELEGSRRILIPSPKIATYDLQPEMSAQLIADALLNEIEKKKYDLVILNFANCDMVGHTAVRDSVVKAVEVVDTQVGRLIEWCEEHDTILAVTADHGNAEEILTDSNRPMTAHTTNLVPFCINIKGLKYIKNGKLGNIAPTILQLLGVKIPNEMTEKSLIKE